MQVRIDVETDTYNTHPKCQLVIEAEISYLTENDGIYLKLSDHDRKISVNANELIKVLQMIV